MGKVSIRLTVFFEDPFWVGIWERTVDGKLKVCKTTFGSEPKDVEVFQFLLEHYFRLRFSPSVAVAVSEKHVNPKRAQREVKKELTQTGVGTKSQQALKLQQEQGKMKRMTQSRQQKEEREDRLFTLKQQKRKEKHRGR